MIRFDPQVFNIISLNYNEFVNESLISGIANKFIKERQYGLNFCGLMRVPQEKSKISRHSMRDSMIYIAPPRVECNPKIFEFYAFLRTLVSI